MNIRSFDKISRMASFLKKSLLALGVILIVFLISFIFSGCNKNDQLDKAQLKADAFFAEISSNNFDNAYQMLTNQAKSSISAAKFNKRYSNICSDLQIYAIEYKNCQLSTNVDGIVYNYTAVYSSEKFGEYQDNGGMIMVYEANEWRVDWTPEQLFPGMTWGDSVRIKTNKAKRGDIVAQKELVATNEAGIAIYALPDQISDPGQFANTIAPLLNLSTQEILSNFDNLKMMGVVIAKEVNVRSGPSTKDTEILSTLISGNTMELIDKLPVITEITPEVSKSQKLKDSQKSDVPDSEPTPKTETESFYHVITEDGIEGYVYADYVNIRHVNDTLMLAQYPKDSLSVREISNIRQIKGVEINDQDMCFFRSYPYGEAFFHIVGYVRKITREQIGDALLSPGSVVSQESTVAMSAQGGDDFVAGRAPYNIPENGYNENSIVGQSGLELQYELELRGKDGIEVYVTDAYGVRKKTIFDIPAQNGMDVHLTIDPALQKRAYDMLKLYMRQDQSSSTIVTNPLTGAVLAMVCYPSIDPNTFPMMTNEQWAYATLQDPAKPFNNLALQGLYAPGSIFKPFTAAVAFDEEKITQNTVFPYADEIVQDQWLPTHINWDGNPPITRVENKGNTCNLYNAMVHSDNIFFAWAAMEVGKEKFLSYCDRLGFNESIPFDLSVAQSSVKKDATNFNVKFLADSGYGQGELLVTPLHMATLYGAFANEGTVMAPYIVESLHNPNAINDDLVEKREPTVWKNQLIDSYIAKVLNSTMADVMTQGTGRAVESSFSLIGKTGTAEKTKNVRDISWLVAFKQDNPKDYLVLVNIDTPANQGTAKNGITSSLMKYYAATTESIAVNAAE